MSQHEFRSSTELTVEEANREHIEGARAFAAAPQIGPAAVDQLTGPRQMPDHRVPVWLNTSYNPSPSLDERVITSGIENFDENDPAMAQARNAFSTATELLKKISEARDPLSRDTSKTPEQKLLLMATITEKQQDRAARVFDNAFKSLTSLIQSVDESLSKPLEQSHTALCKEIREHVKRLPKDERDKFVNDAVRRNDKDVITAVLGVPSYLSGISDERKAIWLRDYRSKTDPTAVARLAQYRRALDLVQERGQLVHIEFEKAMGGKWKDVRRLRGQVSASDAALAALRGE